MTFAQKLIAWQGKYGRNDLDWQVDDPYRIWLSEIMLQQTQVATVKNYFARFVAAFPDVQALAAADQDEVLALWQGLGYYSRARNLHFAAQQICHEYGGVFPQEREELEKLKGVGRSTAAAIAAFAFQKRETILDGNVKRILCRIFALDGEGAAFEKELWRFAQTLLPENSSEMPAYTQGLMDLGATVCRPSPSCEQCPMQSDCLAKQQNRIHELPRKKTVKVKQVNLYWLILRDGERVFLQKREQKGIWAGLYCVPCFENQEDWQLFLQENAIEIDDLQEQQSIIHRLTHRLLEIIPYEYECQTPKIPNAQGVWVLLKDLPQHGLPKPLQQYLQTVSA